MCARHILVPQSLKIELSNDSTGVLTYGGGFGDVWKRQYRGREVAVKALRVYSTSDLKAITRVGRQCSKFFYVIILTKNYTEVLQGIHTMEVPSASERVASDGSENDRE